MKVAYLMTAPAQTIALGSDVGNAAKTMLENDCGSLAVVDSHGHVAGMITDRDICLAMAARHKTPWNIPVREAMSRKVFSCSPDDDVSTALSAMSEHHVRRLPVIDRDGHLQGLISVDDVIRRAGHGQGEIQPDAVVQALRHVIPSRPIRGKVVSA